ncbi:MAG: HAD family hydrolase [Clostridiales bacterium]|nr:HAD family hydrolase [Clostridiales bacterium]
MKKTTFLFDFDGTLADTNQIVIDSWQHTFKAVKGNPGDEKWIISTFGEPLWLSMENAFPGEDVDEMIEIYREYQKQHYKEEIRPFPGMVDVIRELKRRGHKVGVITSRLRPTTEQGLKAFGIFNEIDAIVCAGETEKHKPNPEPALLGLKKLNSAKEDAVMIGDSDFDIICANRAGITSAMVDWAIADCSDTTGPQVASEELIPKENVPDIFIKEAEEILNLA